MPEFLNDTNAIVPTGDYRMGDGGMLIPSGATVQEFGATESSLVWIEPSGQFAIYEATSGWMMADVTPAVAGSAWSVDPINPDDPLVSGQLWFWGEGSGITPDGGNPDTSGVDTWTDAGPYGNDMAQLTDANQPHVGSGEGPNGEDCLWFDGAATYLWRDGDSKFSGNAISMTLFAVVKAGGVDNHRCVWSSARSNSDVDERFGYFNWQTNELAAFWDDDLNTQTVLEGNSTEDQWEIWAFNRSDAVDKVWIWQSGMNWAPAGSGWGAADAPTAQRWGIGALVQQTTANWWDGAIQEVCLYGGSSQPSGTLSDNVMSGIMVYLAEKHGLTLDDSYYV
jgi:hypothetical protein